MRPSRPSGYAAVLAMLLLVLGTTLSAWLFAIVQNGTAMSRNEQSAAQAQMVSESGLEYMQMKLHQACQATPMQQSSDDAAMLVALGNALAGQFPAGQVTIGETVPPSIYVASTNVRGGSFTASLKLSDKYPHGFNLSVTGSAGKVSGTIGTEYDFAGDGLEPWMYFPMLSRETMSINGAAAVYHWNETTNKPDETPGKPTKVSPNDPSSAYVLTFDGSPAPSDLQFPPKYLPDGESPGEPDLYAKLDSMVGSTLQRFTPVQTTDKKGKLTTSPVTELSNCYIPPNTLVTFGQDVTLTGIIYVGYPNNLQLGDTMKLNAVIIYEKPKSPSSSTIDLSRTIAVTTDPAAAQDAMTSLFLKSGESAEGAKKYADMIYPWTIHAPDTDLNMQEGNTGSLSHWGSLHIRNILKSAGSGGGNQSNYVFHGTIVCEGSVDLRGNRKFSIRPEGENPSDRAPKMLSLSIRPGGYWELRP